jgi:hypothetical protein
MLILGEADAFDFHLDSKLAGYWLNSVGQLACDQHGCCKVE